MRAFLVAQSLNQIDKAYGPNHAILDNCHVRVAFAPNDERTAKRAVRCAGHRDRAARPAKTLPAVAVRLAVAHLRCREQETPRPLLTAGEILQLAADDALVLVSGCRRSAPASSSITPIGTSRPAIASPFPRRGRLIADAPPPRRDDWCAPRPRPRSEARAPPVGDAKAEPGRTAATRPGTRRPRPHPGAKLTQNDLDLLTGLATRRGDPPASRVPRTPIVPPTWRGCVSRWPKNATPSALAPDSPHKFEAVGRTVAKAPSRRWSRRR